MSIIKATTSIAIIVHAPSYRTNFLQLQNVKIGFVAESTVILTYTFSRVSFLSHFLVTLSLRFPANPTSML